MKPRHNFRKLNRTAQHRRALLRNLASSLLIHGRIVTTLPKALETRRVAENVIQLAKRNTNFTHKALLREVMVPKTDVNNELITKTIPELAERYKDRNGGYTRVIKMDYRRGDHAPKALIELVGGPGDMQFNLVLRELARLQLTLDEKVKPALPEEAKSDEMMDQLLYSRGRSTVDVALSAPNLIPPLEVEHITKPEFKKRMARQSAISKLALRVTKAMNNMKLTRSSLQEHVDSEAQRMKQEDAEVPTHHRFLLGESAQITGLVDSQLLLAQGKLYPAPPTSRALLRLKKPLETPAETPAHTA
ncbi:hypothetical protein GQ42DRAFT_161566 [Ramicandelaber brevisporus]|nr:hypothetical protein GQ42DRAFT_161566 [Ramicandelaber brevisporus]